MKTWQLFFVLFCISITSTFAQTRIHIKDSSYANIPLRFYAYKTLATHTPKLLKTSKTSHSGKLSITLSLKEAQLLYIPIYSFRLVFYAAPNENLTLKLPSRIKLEQAFSQLKSYSGREIPLFITTENSLNQAIAKYDNAYNIFLKKHFQDIYMKRNAANYKNRLKQLKNLHSSPYFQDYVKYKEAYLYYISGEKEQLLSKYFAYQPILLHNTAYTSLLRKLAEPLATDFTQAPKYKQTHKQINTAQNYIALKAIFKQIAGTEDANCNEHFFIYLLQSAIEQKTISSKMAFRSLKLITQGSQYRNNCKLATAIVKKYKKGFAGSAAPSFSLQATDGNTYTDTLLKTSKPTLLAFFDSEAKNKESIATLEELQKRHNESFHVVVLSAETPLAKLPKTWVQFTIPYHSYVLQDYHLGRFPYYVLVDKGGKISKRTWQQYLIDLEK